MIEYISPFYRVEIGNWKVLKAHRFDVYSGRATPVDLAEIELAEVPPGAIQKGMAVNIWQGYREKGLWQIFSGSVVDLSAQKALTIYCKDQAERLRTTFITQAFSDIIPQEIVKFCLQRAGVTNYRLSARSFTPRHAFVVSGKNVLNVLRLVSQTWGLDDFSWYFSPEGDFYWGPWEESGRQQQGEMVILEYGKNIIDLKPSDYGTGELTTIALPFLRHSHLIRIRDQRFWKREVTARIERIHYHHGQKEARTKLEWRIVAS